MKIANKISLSFVGLVFVIVALAASVLYLNTKRIVEREVSSHLLSVVAAEKETVAIYLQLVKASVSQLSKSVVLEDFLAKGADDPGRAGAFDLAMRRLKRTKEANPAIYEFLLLDKTGITVASSDPGSIGVDRSGDAYFVGGRSGVYLKDAYFSDALKIPLLGAAAPVRSGVTGEFLGVVVARVRMDQLWGVIASRAGLGVTGETYIVNKYGFMITPSRFVKDAFLRLKTDTANFRACVTERIPEREKNRPLTEPVILCRDYRGKLVLGAHEYLPELQWVVISEIDLDEAYLPLRRLRAIFLFILAVCPVLAWLLGAAIASAITRPLMRLYRGIEKIIAGNLNFKVGTRANDEIGRLSRAFDALTDHLRMSTTSVAALNKEIGERRKVEEALRLAERKSRAIFDQAFQFIGLMTTDGLLIDANKAALDLVGVASASVLGKPFWATPWWTHSSDMQERLRAGILTAAAGEFVRFEATHPGADGSLRYIDFSLKPVKDDAGKVIFLIPEGRDITLQKQGELASRQLAAIVESSFDAIISHTTAGVITSWNRGAEQMFGYAAAEMIGKNVSVLIPGGGKENGAAQHVQEPAAGPAQLVETIRQRKDGELIHVSLTISPLRDELGRITGASMIMRDVTEYRRAELARQEAVEARAQFVSMVSHELRTPLTAIEEGIGIVLDGSAGTVTKDQKEFLGLAKRNVDRLARLINDVLDYQKLEAGRMVFHMHPADLGAVVGEAVHMMRPVAKNKGLYLESHIAPGLPATICDKDKIAQVVINLINNAVKFTEKGGVTVMASSDGSSLRISVRDTGPGIKKEDVPKLFQDFSQLSTEASRRTGSTGLGLAISKKIMAEHRGDIAVESELGKGSDFVCRLPVKARFTIMLVDDEPGMVDIYKRSLQEAGYDVTTAVRGLDAIGMIEQNRPDLLVLDMRLPDVSGYEVIGRLRSRKETAALPILATSAFAEEMGNLEDRRDDSALAEISKPFEFRDFLALVRMLLKQEAAG